jgi:hypothetical protein
MSKRRVSEIKRVKVELGMTALPLIQGAIEWNRLGHLPAWLNKPGEIRRKRRILNVIRMTLSALPTLDGEKDYKLLAAIEKAASRYLMRPQIYVPAMTIGPHNRKASIRFQLWPRSGNIEDLDESSAFINYMQMVGMDMLDRLRQCQFGKCGKWYLARFPSQKFCPKPSHCREKHRRSTPEFREKWAKYMRDRYKSQNKSWRKQRRGK